MHPLCFAATLWLFVRASYAQDCYFPDGNIAGGHAPCDSSREVSHCCGVSETCLSNGLCLQSGILSRGSCTDQSWGGQCVTYCRYFFASGGVPIWYCGRVAAEPPRDFIFSCGTSEQNECATANFTIDSYEIVLRPWEVQSVIDSAGVNTGSLNVTRSTTPANNAPQDTAISNVNNASCGAISAEQHRTQLLSIGLGAGLPLVIALAICSFLLWREKRLAKSEQVSAQVSEQVSKQAISWVQQVQPPGEQKLAELKYSPREIDTERRVPELPSFRDTRGY